MLHWTFILLASSPLELLDRLFSPLYKAAEVHEVVGWGRDLVALLAAHGLIHLHRKRHYRGKH